MCLGISGSPMLSLKNKAEALKYAIEFTSTGEYPNRQYNIKKAKELFDFICENVQLPDVETDQLSNSLIGFTSLIEKLSKKDEETQDKVNEAAGTVEGFVEGEEPVKEDVRRPYSGALWNQYVRIEEYIKSQGLRLNAGHEGGGEVEEVFRLNGRSEYLQVTLKYSTTSLPNTK